MVMEMRNLQRALGVGASARSRRDARIAEEMVDALLRVLAEDSALATLLKDRGVGA
jgi:hypothetical protein